MVRNQLEEDVEIIGIVARKQPLNGFFNLNSERLQLAPPFGDGVEVLDEEKTSEKIVVKPGYTARIKIFSDVPLLSISLVEERGRYNISFWSFEPQRKAEYIEAIDPNIKILLTNWNGAGGVVQNDWNLEETIVPLVQGLKNGTRFGFRIVDPRYGTDIVSLDPNNLAVAEGYELEKQRQFNLQPETFINKWTRMELITLESGEFFVVAYKDFHIFEEPLKKVGITQDIDPNITFYLSTAGPGAANKTSFASGESFQANVKGLNAGIRFQARINSKGGVIIPLDTNHLVESKGSEYTTSFGTHNTENWPLLPGSYRMELITVQNEKGYIVAYVDFSINP